MFVKIFKLMTKLKNRYPFLICNPIATKLLPYYVKIKTIIAPDFAYTNITKSKEDAIHFYTQNAKRVDTVANMLADEKSKNTYLGMVKFRQTRKKKDFPSAYYEKTQYFIEEMKLRNNEVFIDCGAYIGDTIDEFLKRCSAYKQIVAFEPELKNFEKLKAKHSNNSKIILINAGAYDKDGIVNFEGGAGSGTIIAGGGEAMSIQVKTIDNLDLEKVTFIKMDIEGAELNALKGAEKTIVRDKPKLAICIYHSDEDMICIAEYIHNLVPEYKLYVRQHYSFPWIGETVLYAIMP